MVTTNVAAFPVMPGSEPKAKKSKRTKAKEQAAKQRRTIGQGLAAAGAAFLPMVSFEVSHVEAAGDPKLWFLVGAALLFSLPSVLIWAHTWTHDKIKFLGWAKAIGFAVLLEGTMVLTHTPWLYYTGGGLLVLINCLAAYQKARGK